MEVANPPVDDEIETTDEKSLEKGTEQTTEGNEEDLKYLWEKIGFHKPLAGFWYNLFLNLIELALGIVLSGVLYNIFYPFPESRGYVDISTAVFGFLITIFNIGTNRIMTRFIAEARIKDVNLMIKYIQYYIWYQMLTGLIQTTAFSIYILFFIPESSLGYAVWIMLLFSTTEFPGWLSVFSETLASLQHFHRSAIIGFLQGEVFQRITEGTFVILGGLYGDAHPEIGKMLGIAIGEVIGTYLDNFLGTLVAARLFSKSLESQGISAKVCFRRDFTWQDVKAPFIFGLKTGLPGLISGFSAFYILTLQIQYFPQLATYTALVGLLGPMFWIIGEANPSIRPLYTESYLNGKKELTRFYIAQSWRFSGLLIGFFLTIAFIVYLFLPDAFNAMELYYYLPAIPFILPYLLQRVLQLFIDEANDLIYAADRATYILISSIIGQTVNMGMMTLVLKVWQLQTMGIDLIIFTTVIAGNLAGYLMTIVAFVYVHKTVVKFKINIMQTFVAPGISLGVTFGLAYLLKLTLYEALNAAFGFYAALIPMVVIFLLMGIFIYFPLTAYLGGWDEGSYKDFNMATRMSGPSKFLVKPINKMVNLMGKKSPLNNKFPIDREVAEKEARELMELKKAGKLNLGSEYLKKI